MFDDTRGRYMSRSEMEQFKIDCPVCGITINLLGFAEHLRKDVENLTK